LGGTLLSEPIRVRILDQEYWIRSEEETEEVLRVAQFVNHKFLEIKAQTEGLSEWKMATLAAFHIASDYFQLLRERDRFRKTVEEKSQELNSRIEALVR
jgi:cell division protein ZapA (FtsZ GTPase activity inhibitor)